MQRLEASDWSLGMAADVLDSSSRAARRSRRRPPGEGDPAAAAAAAAPSGSAAPAWVSRLVAEAVTLADLRAVVREYGHCMDAIATAAAITRLPKLMPPPAAAPPAVAAAAQRLLDRLLGRLLQHLPSLGARELANVLWALAAARHQPPAQALEALVAQLLPSGGGRIVDARPAELAMLAKAAQALAPGSQPLWAAIEACQLGQELGPQAATMLLWAVARAGRGHQQARLVQRIEDWLLAQPAAADPQLEQQQQQQSEAAHGAPPASAQRDIVYAKRLKAPRLARPLALPTPAAAAAHAAASNAAGLQPRELTSAMWALAMLGRGQSPALPVLAQAAADRVRARRLPLLHESPPPSPCCMRARRLPLLHAARTHGSLAPAVAPHACGGHPAPGPHPGGCSPQPPTPTLVVVPWPPLTQAGDLSDAELSTALWATARLGFVSTPLLDGVAQRLYRASKRAAAAPVGGSAGVWSGRGATATAGGVAYETVSLGSRGASARLLATAAWAAAQLSTQPQAGPLIRHACEALLPRMREFRAQDAVNTLLAAARLGYGLAPQPQQPGGLARWWPAVLSSLADRLQQEPYAFQPRDLAGLARVAAAAAAAGGEAATQELAAALAAAAQRQAAGFNELDAAALAGAFAALDYQAGAPAVLAVAEAAAVARAGRPFAARRAGEVAAALISLGATRQASVGLQGALQLADGGAGAAASSSGATAQAGLT
jgi:hypothetical protein